MWGTCQSCNSYMSHLVVMITVICTCPHMQVEESYRSAEGLCKLLGLDAGLVLRFEVPLLQGLGFDLVVHSPYRALAGLFQVCGRLRCTKYFYMYCTLYLYFYMVQNPHVHGCMRVLLRFGL